MHKGVILLTEANTRDDAIDRVTKFLEPYGDGRVWDWYQIGGRWHNTLAPEDKLNEFQTYVTDLLKEQDCNIDFISQKDIDRNAEEIKGKWEALGLKGKNPYSFNQYLMDGEDKSDYNAVPLEDCFVTVKQWVVNIELEKEKAFNDLVKERATGDAFSLDGYYADRYANLDYRRFCFDSNVYDITEQIGEQIPDNIEDYWAVMIDLHN
jgi:hypothetical protein